MGIQFGDLFRGGPGSEHPELLPSSFSEAIPNSQDNMRLPYRSPTFSKIRYSFLVFDLASARLYDTSSFGVQWQLVVDLMVVRLFL